MLDCFCEEEKLDIEYDGGGHRLGVKLGVITDEEFNIKQKNRDRFVVSNGLKIIRIICPEDKFIKGVDWANIKDNIMEEISKEDIIMLMYFVKENEIKTLKRSEL